MWELAVLLVRLLVLLALAFRAVTGVHSSQKRMSILFPPNEKATRPLITVPTLPCPLHLTTGAGEQVDVVGEFDWLDFYPSPPSFSTLESWLCLWESWWSTISPLCRHGHPRWVS